MQYLKVVTLLLAAGQNLPRRSILLNSSRIKRRNSFDKIMPVVLVYLEQYNVSCPGQTWLLPKLEMMPFVRVL